MATKYEDEKNKTAAKASAAQSAAAQAAKQVASNNAIERAKRNLGGFDPNRIGAPIPAQFGKRYIPGAGAYNPNAAMLAKERSALERAAQSNIVGPSVENKPGYRDSVAPRGITADPTNQQNPANRAVQRAAQPGQNSRSPTGNRYLDMATYGRNPLMDNLTMPATEENKKRFFDMGGIQTIRGTMKPDERPSVGWWNPNTLREHATIGEGMMGVDYPVAAQRYGIDAPIQGDVDEAAIKAKADIARERIGLEKPVPVKMVDPMGNESEVLAYPDRTKIGSGEAGGPDPAKVVEDMAAANSREEAQAILEGQPPAVQEQVRKLWGIVRSLGERQ